MAVTTRCVCAALAVLFFPTKLLAQAINAKPQSQQIVGFENFMTSREMWLSLFVLLFGLAIIGVQYLLMRSVVARHISEIFKLFTVTLIIIGTLLLISSGFSGEQIAPALGLFGTIAGYILAKSGDDRASNQSGDERVQK